MKRTLVALYDDFAVAQDVAQDLLEAGYKRRDISVIANDVSGEYAARYDIQPRTDITEIPDDDDVKADEGAGFGLVIGALTGIGAMFIPGVGPVIAAGPLVAALFGAGVGAAAGAATGGIVAALVHTGVTEPDAHYYAEGVRRGGTLVVITADENWVDTARSVMERHQPIDLAERSVDWREGGWSGFDTAAEPLPSDQLLEERKRYTTSDNMSDEMQR